MSTRDILVRVGVNITAFGDAMRDVTDILRAATGQPPATKGLRYWQRREARAVQQASLRGRLDRLGERAEAFLTEIGRRVVNVARSARGDWPDWR